MKRLPLDTPKPTALQQLIIDIFHAVDESEGWSADRMLEHITEPAMASVLHRALGQAGVEVDTLTLEACNYPITPGSLAHHHHPDCCYRMTRHLVVDGLPMAFSGFGQTLARLEVMPSVEACVERLRDVMRRGHPGFPQWHIHVLNGERSFPAAPDYDIPIQRALAPALAEFTAQQIEQATHAVSSRVPRTRL